MEQPSRGRAHLVVSFAVLALLSLCLPGTASAQWTQPDAQGNISNANTGNVGVGTPTPSTALEVGRGGTISLSGGTASGQGNIRFGAQPSPSYDTNLIQLNSNSGTTGIIASGTPVFMSSSGPYVALRGNAYAAIPGQRGNLALSAGGVAGAADAEGSISMRTADQMRLFITHTGNVGIGLTPSPSSAYRFDVAGSARVSQNLAVAGSITVDGNINAKYQDVAEWVPSKQKLAAGTVVVVDAAGSNEVLASDKSYDTGVAGVVSARPGISLGEKAEGKVLVATTGRVKVRVDATRAPIRAGDLLVTSDTEGVAMKSQPLELGGTQIHRPGTIIGKALESLEKGTGEILVLLSLQ
jgi:hypothetical protein